MTLTHGTSKMDLSTSSKYANYEEYRDSAPSTAGRSRVSKSSKYTEVYISIAPDGGWGWCVVLGAFFSYFVSDGLLYSFGIFLKDISITFDCLESQVSLAGAICSCLFCISGPFSAALVNRFGYRKISICGSILASISCLTTSFANSIYMVILVHGLIGGVGFGMIYITAMIAVGFYFERWRALATGIAVSGAGIGGLVLPQVLSALLQSVGWRNTFRALSLLTMSVIMCSMLFKPIQPTKVLVKTESNKSIPTSIAAKGSGISNVTETVEAEAGKNLMKSSSTEVMLTTYNTDPSASASFKVVKYADRDDQVLTGKGMRWCLSCCAACFSCKKEVKTVVVQRPMYRDDILYSGSIIDLPEYRKSMESKKSIADYQISVTRVSNYEEELEEQKKCCPVAMKRILCTMLDVHLLQSPKFLLLVLNGIFSSFGFYTPYIFIKDSVSMHGIPTKMAFWLLSIMGITNTIGRITCGLLTSLQCVKAVALGYCFLAVGGISTILSALSYEMWVQFLYCSVYGIAMSSMSALRTIIIVEMFGLGKLTNAIGMILMFQGVGTLAGISVSGFLKDATGDYKCTFYLAGCCITIGAMFLALIHYKYLRKPNPR